MKKMENLITKYYDVTLRDELAIILFKSDVFELLCHRNNFDPFFNVLENLRKDHKIKALIFSNEPDCLGEKAYDNFLKKIMFQENINKDSETSNFDDNHKRIKELTVLNRFVRYISNYKKLCFSILKGNVVTPFFGLSLATDIRYTTPETYFSLAHNKYGLHPSGGLAYFLVHQLGYNKAIELMFSESISSQEALELGLINKIIPKDNFLDVAVDHIKKITRLNNSVLNSTKRLSSYTRRSLFDYLDFEDIYKP